METKQVTIVEDIVIVGAGIAGLTSSLGLHRLGVRSLVLESSDSLRVTGFALTIWENAWKALDALGIGDILRHQHQHLYGIYFEPTIEPHGREPHVLLLWVAGRGLERAATAVGGWMQQEPHGRTRRKGGGRHGSESDGGFAAKKGEESF
ncbi:hypothetical protein SESBI_04347 [Sesbania bispinosa]|nr:hypothetical protein SESBI_04347 [Sesbania bispinosa]